jgi:hypothetical protein
LSVLDIPVTKGANRGRAGRAKAGLAREGERELGNRSADGSGRNAGLQGEG